MSLDIEATVEARPSPARAGAGRLVGLCAGTATCAGLLLLLVACALWIGWPEGDGLGIYPGDVPPHQLGIDHAVVGLAALLLAAAAAFLAFRLGRSVSRHRGVTLVLGLVLVLPAAVVLGAVGGYALVTVESAQASTADEAVPLPDLTESPLHSPCGYTWTCVESLGTSRNVRLLLPPYADGWGVQVVSVNDPDQLKLFIGRGSDLCLLQSSRVALPAAPYGPGATAATVAVRGGKGQLETTGVGSFTDWSVQWSEAGGYYSVRCPTSVDRATFLASLAVRG